MATSLSSHHLMAALVAGFALSLVPTAPVQADEGPSIRAPRARTAVRVREAASEPVYYAPRYYGDCGRCALPPALPYYWTVRYLRYRYAYRHHHFYD